MRRVMDEMRENMRRANLVKDLVHRTDSPFTALINGYPLPPKFKMPSLDSYDGTCDPFDHIATFFSSARPFFGRGPWSVLRTRFASILSALFLFLAMIASSAFMKF